MKWIKKTLKWFLYFLLIPVIYGITSLILSYITIDRIEQNTLADKTIFLSTNGVHLDIVIPKEHIHYKLMSGLKKHPTDKYVAFGWGDANFYINTPTWNDLTFSNAVKALFLKSPTLMHVTRYPFKKSNWKAIKVSSQELQKLNIYLFDSFQLDSFTKPILLLGKGYTSQDEFYKAKGNYTFYKTCNSWVNSGFKESGLTCCLWTPFDFGLLQKYK